MPVLRYETFETRQPKPKRIADDAALWFMKALVYGTAALTVILLFHYR